MSKYYYHGVNEFSDFIKILKELEIKSPRLQGCTYEKNLWHLGLNGLDYICLCNKLDSYNNILGDNSFEHYIFNNPCFIISDEIDVIKPKVFKWTDFEAYKKAKEQMYKRGIHSTIYADEYRVKDKITADNIIGIGIPFDNQSSEFLVVVSSIVAIAQALGLDIVDSSDIDFVEKYESSKYNKDEIDKKIKKFNLW